eukprot:COSAG04_NODE_28599_length_274_cov_1.182857_1_plen_49_part_10
MLPLAITQHDHVAHALTPPIGAIERFRGDDAFDITASNVDKNRAPPLAG